MQSDNLLRFTFERFGIRGEIVSLAASWRAVIARHKYPPAVREYLGQALAATTLLSGTIKFRGELIFQVQGEGPLHTLVAHANEQRQIRGMALAEEEVPAGDFAEAFGEGRLTLTAESPRGDRYQGIVALEGNSLAQVVEGYFERSEQLATRIWLGASGRVAAGLFLQRLPGETVDVEDWRRICLLAATLRSDELLRLPPRELLRRLFREEDVRLFEPEPVAFRCSCSRTRIEETLRALGREEVEAIIRDRGAVEVNCEFCNAHYNFDAVDVRALFTEHLLGVASDARH